MTYCDLFSTNAILLHSCYQDDLFSDCPEVNDCEELCNSIAGGYECGCTSGKTLSQDMVSCEQGEMIEI